MPSAITLDDLTDNTFSCKESPLWFPNEMTIDDAKILPNACTSCILRLESPNPGPGILRNTDIGFTIDESPLVNFYYNGMDHTLLDTHMLLPGAHRYPGESRVPPAELCLYFKNNKNGRHVCLCIPISDKTGVSGKDYFETLSESPTIKNRPTLSSLLPKDQWIQYKGPDLRGRTKESPTPRNLCDPISHTVTYILSLGSIQLPLSLLNRFRDRKKAFSDPKEPPEPNIKTGISLPRAKSLLTLLPPLKESEQSKKTAAQSVTLNQMKCYRLDSQRDIQGDRIYLGGKGVPKPDTLREELEKAARGELGESESEPRISPTTVTVTVGIILGILIGAIILSVIAYYVLGFTFPNYLDIVNNLYSGAAKPVKTLSSGIVGFFSKLKKAACGEKNAV